MNGPILLQTPSLYQSYNPEFFRQNQKLKQPPSAPPVICDSQTEQQYIEQLIEYIFKENSIQLPTIIMKYYFSSTLSQKRYLKFLVQLMRGLALANKLACTPFSEPQKNIFLKPSAKKFTLLLDLDETLIHTSLQQYSSYCQKMKINGTTLYYMFRPYLQKFLQQLSTYFEIIIFTASSLDYAQSFCQYLPEVDYILSRDHTRQHSSGYLIKDLSIMQQSRNLDNVIIVDNLISCFAYNLNNGIPCIEFRGEMEDSELLPLGQLLVEIANEALSYQCSLKNVLMKKNWRPMDIPKQWKQLMMM